MYRFLYTRVGNREDAEDLTSEVFLKATRQLEAARGEASVAKWLFTVARTVLADHWRRYYSGGPTLALTDVGEREDLREAPAPEGSLASQGRAHSILSALPPRYRQVLELRFLRGYSIDETARAMDITPGNVKVLQHRALAKAVQVEEREP